MGNQLCHFEFQVTDVAKTKEFYSKVFDWKFDDSMEGYTMIKTGTAPEGGMMLKPEGAPFPALQVYFLVDSADQTLEKVKKAGGQVLVPKTPVGDMGFFAFFMGPDNIGVGIWESAKK
ncbi:MAG: VOC family protein [Candidatus Eiseniibacteriota bacterium]|nr:MAG: VOC family protein [Candidatus Eisenbacteria bacterium]